MRDMIHMSASECEAYAKWLLAKIRGLRGSIAQRLRQAAQAILDGGLS